MAQFASVQRQVDASRQAHPPNRASSIPPPSPSNVPRSAEDTQSTSDAEFAGSRPNFDFSKVRIHSDDPVAPGGNLASGRAPSSLRRPRQTNMEIGRIGDPLEQEADRVAEQIMGMDTHHNPARDTSQSASVQKKARVAMAEPSSVRQALRSPGEPLTPTERRFFEPRFGFDFSHVRVHSDAMAESSAETLGARAYTTGRHIVLGSARRRADSGKKRLMAHELAHVVQQSGALQAQSPTAQASLVRLQASPGKIQRQAVPKEEFARLIEDMDRKLDNPRLSTGERLVLLQDREKYFEYLQGMEDSEEGLSASFRFTAPMHKTPSATPRFHSQTAVVPAVPAAPQAPAGGKVKPVPSTGSMGNKKASAKAAAADSAKEKIPAPSTPYTDTNVAPRNEREAAKHAEESAIGKRLNEMAVGRQLKDVRKVEGRRPVQGASSDYVFTMKDGTLKSADLYSPQSETTPEAAALRAIAEKSAQGEIVVLHLQNIKRPLEYAQKFAEALLVTPNHGLKEMIAFSDYKVLVQRSLTADPKVIDKLREKVTARMEGQRKSDTVNRPEWAKQSERKASEPARLSQQQLEQLRAEYPKMEMKSLFKAEEEKPAESSQRAENQGLFQPDPHAVEIDKPVKGRMSTQAAIEGGAQMALGAQVESVRSGELNKALDAWDALQPKIQKLRSQGYDVTVTVVAQVPKSPNAADYIAGVGNPGEVVYFYEMYIAGIMHRSHPGMPIKGDPNAPPSMRMPSANEVPQEDLIGDPDQFDRPGWADSMQEAYEMKFGFGNYKPPMKGFRYEWRDVVMPAED